MSLPTGNSLRRLLDAGPPTALRAAYSPDAPLPVRSWLGNPVVRGIVFVVLLAAVEFAGITAGESVPGGLPDWCYGALEIVAALGAYLVVSRWLEGRARPWELDPRRARGLVGGLLLGAAMCLLAAMLVLAGGWRGLAGPGLHGAFGIPVGFAQWVFILGASAGIAEEVMFRGILFRLVEQGVGTWGATAVSAAVFGAVHLSNPNATVWGAVAIALEAGVAFALLYALTRSLWVVIGVHAAWNVVQGPILGFAVSGATVNGAGLLRSMPRGPEWLSGGEFGLEATPASVLVWLALAGWLGRELRRRGGVVPPAWRRRPRPVTHR